MFHSASTTFWYSSTFSNRQFRKHNLCSRGCDAVQFIIEDVPLSVNHLLVLINILQPNLSIIFLCLQLKFDVKKSYLWIFVILLLHFKTSITESFLKSNSRDQLSVFQCTSC